MMPPPGMPPPGMPPPNFSVPPPGFPQSSLAPPGTGGEELWVETKTGEGKVYISGVLRCTSLSNLKHDKHIIFSLIINI